MSLSANRSDSPCVPITTGELRRRGLTARTISRTVEVERLVRLRQGWYADGTEWAKATSAAQHLAAIRAAHHGSSIAPVFSHRSAATLHGLPVWSRWMEQIFSKPDSGDEARTAIDPRVVHVTHSSRHGTAHGTLVRHRAVLRDDDIQTVNLVECGILRLTSPDRTLIDLARSEPFGVALACTDALLRHAFRIGRHVDHASWDQWRSTLIARTRQSSRQRGMVAVRALVALADPRSDSVLESVSRLRFHQLGIAVELQRRVPAENGGNLYLDFTLTGRQMFGECDGRAKYLDASVRGEHTADDVLYAEKRRHDWITASTKMRGIRWGASDVATLSAFRSRLRSFGIYETAGPSRAHGHDIAELISAIR